MNLRGLQPLALLALAGLAQAQTAAPPGGQIYVGLGTNGEVQVEALPFPGAKAVQPGAAGWLDAPSRPPLRTVPAVPAVSAPKATANAAINSAVQRAADVHGVDAGLLHAVIKVESNYRHRVVSRAGAAGLMQLMPATAKRFGVADRFNIEQNVLGGAAYLKWLHTRFSGDLDLVLAAYNAGEGAVQKHGNRIPPYRETQAYVVKVRSHYVASRN
jgi:soluble lytic murein transglycosylase-like protein